MSESIQVTVPRDLEPLMPRFLANRKLEIARMQASLAAADFDAVRQAGHSLKGVGGSFGFQALTDLGGRIETSANACDTAAVAASIEEYADYMNRLAIRFE